MSKIIIHDDIDSAAHALLATRDDVETVSIAGGDHAGLLAEIADADAVILRYLPLDGPVINAAKNLKVIARHGVGYDNVDVPAANACGVPVATIGEANSVTVAELALYLMLAVSKYGLSLDQAVRSGNFGAREQIEATELYEKSVLVVGFGRIGTRVAARCRAFEMEVRVCDPYIPQSAITEAGFIAMPKLAAALPAADIVTLHVPLNDATRHMMDGAALARMKPGGILINTSRGPVVDANAVRNALDTGHLSGAGFDVFEPEPPGTDHPLLNHPRTVLTPHVGGATQECFRRSSLRSAQHALDAIDGRLERAYVVNPEVLG